MKRVLIGFVLIVLSSVVVAWPTKPITVVVPYTPGGTLDIMARALAPDLSEMLKKPITIKNMPGASNMVAVSSILTSENDNHTIIFTQEEMLTSSIFTNQKSHDQFVPLNIIATSPYVFYTGKKNFTINDFLAEAKAGKSITMATGGPYSTQELWKRSFVSNFNITTVPFKGMSLITQAVLGGHIEYHAVSAIPIQQMIANKQVTPLMVLTEKRLPHFPDVPTYLELGFGGPPAPLVWFGAHIRKDSDKEAIQQLNDTFQKVVASNTTIRYNGLDIINLSGKQALQFYQKEVARLEGLKSKISFD